MGNHLKFFFVAWVFCGVEMGMTWWWALRIRNYGIVDVVWSAGFSVIALIYWALSWFHASSDGLTGSSAALAWRSSLLTLMGVAWSLRLGGHLLRRVARHHPNEDVRYAKLRANWGERGPSRMFWFFQVQGALQAILSLPFLVVCLNPLPPALGWPWGVWESAGFLVWIGALVGESVADAQLAAFRRDPANQGQVCQTGLWRWSRHPNYFFEWLIWVAFWLCACAAPWGWLTVTSPALILHFLINVTGIPMTEDLSIQSKGEAYREYQRTTSAFFPWPRRRRMNLP